MSALRAKMIEQMQLHRKAPGTQDQYVKAIARLAAYYKRSPDQLTPQEIRALSPPSAHRTSTRLELV